MPSPRVSPFTVLGVFVVMAGCATADVAPEPAASPTPPTVRAFRYLADVWFDNRMRGDILEVWLPDHHLACNTSDELVPTKEQPLRIVPFARAFELPAPRNRDRDENERPTERYELPADVVADIVELARLTREQKEFARRVAARLLPIVPLDR